MKREFVETNIFRRLWVESGLKEQDLHALQNILLEFPDAGDVIPGTGGLRKIRVAASGRGKRGGARVFSKDFTFVGKIFFVFLILKKDDADLSGEQRKRVHQMIKEIEEDLNMEKNNFALLMQSLEEAKSHVRGKKGKAKVASWEIKPASDFAAKDIKRVRHKIGLSQSLFAEFLGVSVRTIQSWEQGMSHPSGASSRLLEALDRSKEKCLSLYQEIKVISAVG